MKKAFDQTVRDLKREVNKKVLKVPGIEQKILDATSNEPWGPHGSYLAEIAQATRNYHEYQMIMSVIWKRINDTGKNWRHVYKGLTVLEYLVAHGSDRVIDDIREHAYQISTLSDFQYIDSHGRDQGNNVRKKSQSLVALVNDKERIQEARQKALANKDKYRSTFSTGGMYRTGSGGGYGDRYDDDRYEGRYRDDDYNGYSRERDGSYRDEDRYGRNGDSHSHDGDRFGRDPDRFGSRNDDYQFGSRSRSADRARGRSFDDEDQYSSRSGGGRADDSSHDERHVGHKSPEQTGGAPPSYEEATKAEQNQIPDERDGKPSAATAGPTPKVVSPPPKASPHSETTNSGNAAVATSMPPSNTEAENFDEFDPRGFTSVAVNSVEVDLFGSFSAEDSLNSLALVPVSASTTSESDVPVESGFTNNFPAMPSTSTVLDQSSTDPFGDSPFRATTDGFSAPVQNSTPFGSSQPTFLVVNNSAVQPAAASKVEPSQGFDFGESFLVTNTPSSVTNFQPPATQVLPTPPSNDVLDILFTPSNGVAPAFPSQVASGMPPARSQTAPPEMFAQSVPPVASQAVYQNQFSHPGTPSQVAPPNPFAQSGASSQMVSQNHFGRPGLPSAASSPDLLGPSVLSAPTTSALPPNTAQSKNKFETKSTVWADTLSRGLVDLNISGVKVTNSAVDIGVDFDSINRKEKMKEKKNTLATPMSTITMGKAMGSGSGIGRSGATGLPPPPNPMTAPRPGMGMGGVGMGGGFGGGMNQTMNMGGGYGGGMNQGMGMGMNMGMGQGAAVRPGYGMPPGAGMPGVGYNPMMGMGGYGSQQPYGGYR